MLALRLVAWQRVHGRNGLPWQRALEPYPVWLSEVMLQQTQVSTVIPFFNRFMRRFPSVQALAEGSTEDVLALWSGLGYYSRARALHACAKLISSQYDGQFPRTCAELEALPGIGPSTAAAISSICFGEPVSIFDGNVQRVLARYVGFEDDLSATSARRALKRVAQSLVPDAREADTVRRYTQGLMDLGAGVCTPRNPRCGDCPVQDDCVARSRGLTQELPRKTRRLRRSAQSLWLLMLQREDGAVWLEARPPKGIWGGLHAFPLCESEAELFALLGAREAQHWPVVLHALTHKDLFLHPVHVRCDAEPTREGRWLLAQDWKQVGLPAPISRLLEQLTPTRGAV